MFPFFILSRPFGKVIHYVAEKYDHAEIANLRKLERISIKTLKAELDLNFQRNCRSFNVLSQFVHVDLPTASQHGNIQRSRFANFSVKCNHKSLIKCNHKSDQRKTANYDRQRTPCLTRYIYIT